MAQLLDPVRVGTLQNVTFPEVTFSDSGDLVTRVAHGLGNGSAITLISIAGTSGIATGTTYYVKNATANTFKLAANSNLQDTINLVGNGTGKMCRFLTSDDIVDGMTLLPGMRVLVKSQTLKNENGIYVVTSDSRLVRASDFADGTSIQAGTAVFIQEGNTLANTGWVLTANSLVQDATPVSITIGVETIYFDRFSVNLTLNNQDVPSAIVLRSIKGYPLTIDELDNNFKYLSQTLNVKLNISDFTRTAIKTRLNTLDTYTVDGQVGTRTKDWQCQDNSLNAWELRGYAPSFVPTQSGNAFVPTLVLRDENGDITTQYFRGDLLGYADNAYNADHAAVATDVDGVVKVEHGGTGAVDSAGARLNLGAVNVNGDRMFGKLTTVSASINSASLNIAVANAEPNVPAIGDVWATGSNIKYYLNGAVQTVAPLNSPVFTGDPQVTDNPGKSSNSKSLASTYFVQQHVADLNAAINLKAPIDNPDLTGAPQSVTPPTADNSRRIATTNYVVNKFNSILPDYYTATQVDGLLNVESTSRSNADIDLQSQIDEVRNNVGVPVGTVMYYATSAVPPGWLECNGAAFATTAYPQLFAKLGHSYGGSGNIFNVPDLRGEFIRGWDNGRLVDPNRAVGSNQKGTMVINRMGNDADNDSDTVGNGNFGSQETYGSDLINDAVLPAYEGVGVRLVGDDTAGWVLNGVHLKDWASITRPRNVAMVPCIKAFGQLDNPDLVNATAVLADITNKIDRRGDAMAGDFSLYRDPTQNMHAATKQYVDHQIDLFKEAYTFTYGVSAPSSWDGSSYYFDVFPPAGKTVADLKGFIPSSAGGYNNWWWWGYGGTGGSSYSVLGDRIRVSAPNYYYYWYGDYWGYYYSGYHDINWLAIWG